jgi:glycosyltransferase involved in cell wall biosynthesis
MMSSNERNLNYRYIINKNPAHGRSGDRLGLSDLSSTTYNRRLLKKEQSHAHKFIFDITQLGSEQIKNQLDQIIHLNGSLLLSAEQQDNVLATRLETYMLVKNKTEFERIKKNEAHKFIFQPECKPTAHQLVEIQNHYKELNIQWSFQNYDSKIKNSLTVTDIADLIKKYKIKKSDLPFFNTHIPSHYELEALIEPKWSFHTQKRNIQISIIIPTYNNCLFLCNTVQHLISQSVSLENYEIIVTDDGSTDQSEETLYSLLKSVQQQVNIKYIYWPKVNSRGSQNFFRAGLARNLAAHHSEGSQLFFLDSDMLVPKTFIKSVIENFNTADVIQFSRFHIKQTESLKNPRYDQIQISKQTYIEDEKYWNQLFKTNQWSELHNYWKYTCTYALGMSKSDFYDCGRFKRHFISYGFEDTDLGFRLYQKNRKFKLIQQPLLHLTNYNSMQYQNSKFLRDQLLRKTSKLLFLDHLDMEIFEAFKFYYQFEKPLFCQLRDIF